jgi:hypothetical protein
MADFREHLKRTLDQRESQRVQEDRRRESAFVDELSQKWRHLSSKMEYHESRLRVFRFTMDIYRGRGVSGATLQSYPAEWRIETSYHGGSSGGVSGVGVTEGYSTTVYRWNSEATTQAQDLHTPYVLVNGTVTGVQVFVGVHLHEWDVTLPPEFLDAVRAVAEHTTHAWVCRRDLSALEEEGRTFERKRLNSSPIVWPWM